MIVEVNSAAVSRRLVHLEAVKADLGITDTSEDTDLLRAIDILSSEVVRILGREPWRQQYKVRMAGDGGTMLALPVWPAETPSLVRYGVTSPSTMTAADYEVVDRYGEGWFRWLYKDDEWARTATSEPTQTAADARELYYEVTLFAGWACPLRTWEASTAVRLGEYALATDRSDTTVFEVTTAGTTGSSEPTWSTTDAATTADSTATWTARATARGLPESLHAAGIWAVKQLFRQQIGAAPAGVSEIRDGQHTRKFSPTADQAFAMPAVSQQIFERYAAA